MRHYITTLLTPLVFGFATIAVPQQMKAQSLGLETISQIAKSDPLIITGAVGTRNTYYYSSVGSGYRSPLSNTIFANLNVNLYGINMPFSIYYSNDNTSFSYPHFTFNLNPHYKNWTGHLGRSSMAFSNYLLNMSFNGIGVEYDDHKRFRAGVFWGILRNAVNDNPDDPAARAPQYRRSGWGFKVGYGSKLNYIDLYLLRAYDSPKSIDEGWRHRILPQENLAVALKGSVSPVKFLSLSGNLAMSAFTADRQGELIGTPETEKFDKIFDTRYTSLARFAGDLNLNLMFPSFTASLVYRMVQPDYTSLGTYYMTNNYQSFGLTLGGMLLKKVSLAASFAEQEDNLSRNQLYTTRGYVYSANASSRIIPNLNIVAGFNGYLQNQGDGTAKVNDTTRVNRVSNSFYITPSYMIESDLLDHTISLTGSFTENVNLNKLQPKESNVQTFAVGANYGLDLKAWELNTALSFSHQQSRGYKTKYTTDILSLTADHSFLSEKNLTASATISLVHNNIVNRTKNFSLGGDVSLSYLLKKVHAFSFSAGFNKYSDVNLSDDYTSMNTTEVNISLNYVYTFTLLEIKRKTATAPAPSM